MKATDLMIGDWVFWARNHIDARGVAEIPVLLETILRHGVSVFCDDNLVFIRNEDIDPIPLTAEILKKNGFRKGMREYTLIHFEKNELPISLNPLAGGGFEWTDSDLVIITEIHFVHELQHALKLCGIEKEIVL